ncbi:hypothetical protein GGR54DRAFT_581338 [Hypoxylon sp. NC1633]|nr:hypothetical protein GGR54DRAFT_581338 [Hypoxylon sp. NC1633]
MSDSDSDPDPDSRSPKKPAPQTPPRNATAEHHPWSAQHGATTPKSSSPASPSLSLHSLGMSPFSPVRRQLSSPFAGSPSFLHPTDVGHSEHEDLVQDSRDVLVQRLNDLAAKLNQQDDLQEDNVYSLHATVDEMEQALSTRDHLSRRGQRSRPTSLILQNTRSELNPFWGSLSPGRTMPGIANTPLRTQKSSSTQTDEKSPIGTSGDEPQMSAAQASRIAAEAQHLQEELESVVSSLRARQEESDHIHDMLITRAERAAQRIIHLEKRVKELESERNEGEMEMVNLQIQLKAIEVQCLAYVPEDADHELRESISAWKMEWSALKRKRARRKAGAGEDLGTSGTPTRQPRRSPG